MTGLRYIALGVGDAFSADHYSSCVAVEHEGQVLLIDCPHPIRKMMKEANCGFDLDAVAAVALTHLHADHASGLEGYGYFGHFCRGEKARIVAHRAVRERLWDGHLAAGMERLLGPDGDVPEPRAFDAYFEWLEVSESAPARVGAFTIECRATRHHIPCTAFRVRAGGRSMAFSGDTSFDRELIVWLAEADIVVHETNYGVHTPYESLAELPAALRAKMRLIHYPDGFDGRAIEPLRQGEWHALPR